MVFLNAKLPDGDPTGLSTRLKAVSLIMIEDMFEPVPSAVPLTQIASHQVLEVGAEKIRMQEIGEEKSVNLVIDRSDQSTAFVPGRPWNAETTIGGWSLTVHSAEVLDQRPWLYSGFSVRFDERPDQRRPIVIIGLSNGEIIGSE